MENVFLLEKGISYNLSIKKYKKYMVEKSSVPQIKLI